MSTITAQDQASTTTTAAERGRARALAAMTEVKAPAGYRALTAAEAADTSTVDGELELIAGVGLVVKLPEDTDADVVADLQAVAKSGGDLAALIREALTAANQAGVQTGRYISGAGDTQTMHEAMHHADAERERATVAMWRAFYDQASR